MTTSPYYADAVVLLSALHSTTAEIIHQNWRDDNSDLGRQLARELSIVILYTELIASRKCACNQERE